MSARRLLPLLQRLERSPPHPIAACLGRALREPGGAIAVVIAVALAAVIGAAGLGTEAAGWYLTKRNMQGAADVAATTAAAALAAGEPSDDLATEAKSVAAGYHFVAGENGTTVTVNYPPKSGNYQSSPAVEVIISQPEQPLLSALLLSSGPTISARAVALANTSQTGQACVVGLDTNNETAVTTAGSTALQFQGCSLYVNSPSPAALSLSGGATIAAASAYLVGNVSGGGLTTTYGTYTNANPLIDPYINAAVPAYSGCDQNNYKLVSGQSTSLSAGPSGIYVFCGGISLQGGSSLTLGAGTYIMDGGQLNISGNATLNATSGTTIILTSSSGPTSCATASIGSNAVVNLTAPTSGALSGIAMFQDRTCANKNPSNSLTGGATQNIIGAIYFPREPVSYSGGSPTGGAQCTQLVAWTVTFTGGSTFNNNCSGTGTRSTSLTGGRLVE
jgi:Flp pilus assembly protein TadG